MGLRTIKEMPISREQTNVGIKTPWSKPSTISEDSISSEVTEEKKTSFLPPINLNWNPSRPKKSSILLNSDGKTPKIYTDSNSM